jgi:hypothetical protein
MRLEGESGFVLVDSATGAVQEIDAEDMPEASELRIAEAQVLPAESGIPSRKFYAGDNDITSRKFYADSGIPSRKFYAADSGVPSRKFYLS